MARVLTIVPYHALFPPTNGGALRCFYLLRELARVHEVHAIILQSETEFSQPQNGFVFPDNVYVYSPVQRPAPRTRWHSLPPRLRVAVQYRWLRRSIKGPAQSLLLETYHLIHHILTTQAIDAVLYEHLATTTLAPIVRRLNPAAKGILDEHNIEHLLIQQSLNNQNISKRCRSVRQSLFDQVYKQETHLYQIVDAFFACSEDDRQLLMSLNHQPIPGFAIPNGVDTRANPFDVNPTKQRNQSVLFCGSLGWEPNRDGLIWFYNDIWPLVRARMPQARLLVIGRGAQPGDFMQMRQDSSVNFVGEVDDVKPYYDSAALAVIPLRMGSGTRLKALEAMSLGTPLVSTSHGVQGIKVIDGKHLLIADEPDKFAAAVSCLLKDSLLYENVRQAARQQVVTHYDWPIIGQQMNDIIESLLTV